MIFPTILPALLTGFALAFARALGEYGSVVFISGNMPMKTEITSLLIIIEARAVRLRGGHGDRRGDAGGSFVMLLAINVLQWWTAASPAGGSEPWRHRATRHARRQTGGKPDPAASGDPGLGPLAAGRHRRCGFSALFLLLPLAAVFAEALRKGWEPTSPSFDDADGLAADQADACSPLALPCR